MGFTFNLNKTNVELQKNGKKIKFENEDLLRRVSKINRRLKKKEDLFGCTWSGFTVILKRVINIGGINLEANQWEQVFTVWRSLEKGVYYFL